MDYQVALSLALPIGLGIAAFGSALGMGKAVSAALESSARQPEIAGKMLVSMIIGCALIETLTIYAFVFALMLSGKIS